VLDLFGFAMQFLLTLVNCAKMLGQNHVVWLKKSFLKDFQW
jgi:hypothetical protein